MLAKIPKSHHKSALLMLRQIPYAETRQEADRLKGRFQHWRHKKGLEAAAALIDQDWDRMVTFYNYPEATMAASADHQPGGIAFFCAASAH